VLVTLEATVPVVDRYELGPIGTNCYLVRAESEPGGVVVVDPGGDAPTVLAELERLGASCAAILITHTHWDHIGAVADLAEATGAPVYVPELEAPVMRDPSAFYPGIPVRAYEPDVVLAGDEVLELAGLPFQTLSVPGHSPGHLAFATEGCIFSGDVLFLGSVGRTDLPMADWNTLLASIRRLTERYPPDTVVYSGHGPPTTLGAELAQNPFLTELRK
jgi:glyoxylase-like metal-dependent hydrolase (beta-lactamase superfamily II)